MKRKTSAAFTLVEVLAAMVLRGIVLKGVGPTMLWPELAALGAFALIVVGLASMRLRRQWS